MASEGINSWTGYVRIGDKWLLDTRNGIGYLAAGNRLKPGGVRLEKAFVVHGGTIEKLVDGIPVGVLRKAKYAMTGKLQ